MPRRTRWQGGREAGAATGSRQWTSRRARKLPLFVLALPSHLLSKEEHTRLQAQCKVIGCEEHLLGHCHWRPWSLVQTAAAPVQHLGKGGAGSTGCGSACGFICQSLPCASSTGDREWLLLHARLPPPLFAASCCGQPLPGCAMTGPAACLQLACMRSAGWDSSSRTATKCHTERAHAHT